MDKVKNLVKDKLKKGISKLSDGGSSTPKIEDMPLQVVETKPKRPRGRPRKIRK